MDQGKILILNLSRGLIGEDNASILGAMIITKIQLAAMSRADIQSIEDRRPFYLYVDEFQNFATDSFAVILSEARKYGLYLTLANQYISQMPPEVRGAVFGNVGSIVSFRVSPEDAPFLEQYFSPQFNTSDIVQLANRNFVATMTIGGEKVPAFSGQTLDLVEGGQNNLELITQHSRQEYANSKAEVEELIKKNVNQQDQNGGQQSPNQGQQGQSSSSKKRKRKRSQANSQSSRPPAMETPLSDNPTLEALKGSLGSTENQPADIPESSSVKEPTD